LLNTAKGWRGSFLLGWVFGLAYFLVELHWVGQAFLVDAENFGWMMPFAVSALSAGLALFAALAAGATRRFSPPGLSRLFAFALFWGLTEWLRGSILTGFPWLWLAAAQTCPDNSQGKPVNIEPRNHSVRPQNSAKAKSRDNPGGEKRRVAPAAKAANNANPADSAETANGIIQPKFSASTRKAWPTQCNSTKKYARPKTHPSKNEPRHPFAVFSNYNNPLYAGIIKGQRYKGANVSAAAVPHNAADTTRRPGIIINIFSVAALPLIATKRRRLGLAFHLPFPPARHWYGSVIASPAANQHRQFQTGCRRDD
jgi:hypothetical protein